MPGTSIATSMNATTQDDIIDVANMTLSGGTITRARAATVGEFKGALVFHANNKGGVTSDLAPPDSVLPDGTTNAPGGRLITPGYHQTNQRGNFDGNGPLFLTDASNLIIVGYHFFNGYTRLTRCSNITFAYCTFDFGMDPWWYYGWDRTHPSGDAGTNASNGQPYGYNAMGGRSGGPRAFLMRSNNRNIRLYNCDILYGGSGFTTGNGDANILLDGCRTLEIGQYAGIPALGTIGDPDDILHDDAIGITTGPLSVRIVNTSLGVAQAGETAYNARLQLISSPRPSLNPDSKGGPINVEIENCWFKGASGPGLNFGSVFTESPVTGYVKDTYVWDHGGADRAEMWGVWNQYDFSAPYNDHPQYVNVPMTNVSFSAPGVAVTQDPAILRRAEYPYANYLDLLEDEGLYFPSAPSPPAAPTAPTGVVASVIDASRINLAWDNGTGTIERTYVERSLNGSTWTELTPYVTFDQATSFSVAGLAASTLYYFRVRHWNSGGYGSYSSTVSKITNAPPPPVGNPSTVPIVTAVQTSTGFGAGPTANMTRPAGAAVGNYILFFCVTGTPASGPINLAPHDFELLGEWTATGALFVHLSGKFLDADDPASWAFAFDSAVNSGKGALMSFSGVHTSDPIDVIEVTEYSAATTGHTAPTATPDGDYGLQVVLVGGDDGSGITYTGPAGFNERWDLGNSVGSVGCAGYTKALAAAGATGTAAAVASGAETGVAINLVLRSADSVYVPPPPGGEGPPPIRRRANPNGAAAILF
jgi:hypothetical protein